MGMSGENLCSGSTRQDRQEEHKATCREGKACLVPLLTPFQRVCRQCVKEGKDTAPDGSRSRHSQSILSRIRILTERHGESWCVFQGAVGTKNVGTIDEMERCLHRLNGAALFCKPAEDTADGIQTR